MPLVISFAVIGSLMVAVTFWRDDLVERTLLGHAQSSAATWRTEFTNAVPNFEALFKPDTATQIQRDLIEATIAGSDIFRFEAFDAQGNLTFVSDQALFAIEPTAMFNAVAVDVAGSGVMDVEVEDGRGNPKRPDWYVEAYMPVTAGNGAVIGVVEVYVDVSGLAAALSAKFNWFSLVLLITTALIYVVPTLLFINRNTQLRQRDQQMLSILRLDPLTGLLNRAAFNEFAARTFNSLSVNDGSLGILFIDMDKFKEVNDTLGHNTGDALLQHVAEGLKNASRTDDVVGRLGGDEFVVLCPGVTQKELLAVGERIVGLQNMPFLAGTNEVRPSLSLGAHLVPAGQSQKRALHCADLAVYKAKANGRSQVVVFSKALEQQDVRRQQVADCIRIGLKEKLFFLNFQPVFDRNTAICGFEALLRLRTPSGELIPPAEFIPIAEDIGLIEELGLWTLRDAIKTACAWPRDLFISINVSAHEFRSGKLAAYLTAVMAETGLQGQRICLELTENTLNDHTNEVADQLADLKGLGLQIALDDFGTGPSSLSHLWGYPFDRLKIDRSLLEAYDFDPTRQKQRIQSIVTLGHQLGMSVTAEGVAHVNQLELMRGLECEYFQGFLLSEPVSSTQALAMTDRAASA